MSWLRERIAERSTQAGLLFFALVMVLAFNSDELAEYGKRVTEMVALLGAIHLMLVREKKDDE